MTSIAIVGLATISFGQTLPSYVPTEGLVGWWPFNGNANDESGNGNDGTVNGAILTSDRLGNQSNAFIFNGVSDFIQCLNSGPSGSGPITLSFWFYSNSDSTQTAFSYGGSSWGTLFDASINWKPSGSGPCFGPSFVAEGTGISWGSVETQALSWHHVVIVVPESSTDCTTLLVNVDGQIATTCSFANYGAPNLNFGNSNPIQIGKSHSPNIGVGNSNFHGKLDDIGIWNRALTQEEISSLYSGSSAGIKELSQSNLFSVFPNPAQSVINVNIEANLVGSVFTIYDNTGKAVKTGKLNSSNTTIDVNDLSGGIYSFNVGGNRKQTFKVIKE